MQLTHNEQYGTKSTQRGLERSYSGEVEFITRVPGTGQVIDVRRERNIIKLFAKEILSHRLPHIKVWDPNASSGVGAWVAHSLDLDELAPKYICFGASFDGSGQPLDAADTRFYVPDEVSGGYIPRTLEVGATNGGGLINAIPIAEPNRPLKRIERIYFEPSYQPAGVPLLQDDVRAINNVVVFETVLRKEEYNGFGMTDSDYFTITEVALVAAKEVGAVGSCECDPHHIFMEGKADGTALPASASGTQTVTLDNSLTSDELDLIREGDQVKIVAAGGEVTADELSQVSPYYLVLSKVSGGRDVVLDRTPYDDQNSPITGPVGLFRDGFRLFSHRLLKYPVRKNVDFELVVRWRISMS